MRDRVAQVISLQALRDHVADFHQSLLAKGNTADYAKLTVSRVKRVLEGCKFSTWTDISASRVQRYLVALREGEEGISAQTFNYYLQAIKQFCRWMVDDRRASESPLSHLKPVNPKTDRRLERRALEPDELRYLLEVARNGLKRFGMTGPERAMLYRLAAETGLRANELRSLKVSSFDFDLRTVSVQAAYSKRRDRDILPLRQDTVEQLKHFLSGKMPQARAFNLPSKYNMADMLRADLAEAEIPYEDESGRVFDFHSFRHTTGSLLAASGVHPKVAQVFMRHSTVELTLGRYSHVYRDQETEAVEKLPDLSLPSNKQKAMATGTGGTENSLAHNLSLFCGKPRISADNNGQMKGETGYPEKILKASLEAKKPGFSSKKEDMENTPGVTRTRDLRIRNPLLYPN